MASPATQRQPGRQATAYTRHRPERTLLYETVNGHLATFYAQQAERGGILPRFVQRTLDGYLRCGILAHGFARLRCRACRHDQLVAFSCKARGVCPSCAARRTAAGAAHLVDAVLPHVPVRQWVFSLPHAWRYRIAYDAARCSQLLGLCIRAAARRYRAAAKRLGLTGSMAAAHTGSVTAVQRFSGGLGLNVHFHVLVLDGVYLEPAGGRPRFAAVPPPSATELTAVAAEVAAAAARLDEAEGACAEDDARGHAPQGELLAACSQASVLGCIATGPRAGARTPRLRARPPGRGSVPRRRLPPVCAEVDRFNVHAGVRVPAHDRRRLEKLCRYVLRPPLCPQRLRALPDGTLAYELHRPWADGTTALRFTPLELIARLVPLIPPPRAHQVIYHGVLSSHARLRPKVVPPAPARATPHHTSARSAAPQPTCRHSAWAELMRRVYAIDVLLCPRCGQRMALIATIVEVRVIRAILLCMGLPAEPPDRPPARPTEHNGISAE